MSELVEQQFKSLIRTTETNPVNYHPAKAYLLSLKSLRSRKTIKSVLNKISESFGCYSNIEDPCFVFNWNSLDRIPVLAFLDALRQQSSHNTVKLYLSAIKGVMREAWALGMIDAEHLERIVRNIAKPDSTPLF